MNNAQNTSNDLPTRYDPQSVETDLYDRWMATGCFRSVPDERPPYCVTVPPPNITGALHLGHALNHTIMDTLGRWKRMSGYNVLILPGTDHGGISTQTVVEREIKKDGLTRHDLGREAFLKRVEEWADQYGGTILSQLKRLGCAYDWERTRYTLDADYHDAILDVFIALYNEGYIYLGERIVNWSPVLMTVISDIEVDTREVDGSLWHFRYPFADGSGSVIVATTRPETMLGDTGVAVNPTDDRYAAQIGKMLRLPLVGREIPLFADDYVDAAFGTGAVKVTPFHDPNDYDMGIRHNLPRIEVIGADAKMTETAGIYARLDRFEARKRIVADMEEQGYLVKVEPYRHAVPHCDRSGAVIEPRVSLQWFCRQANTDLIRNTIADAESGAVRFVPERYKDLFVRWLENIRDWPISRQIWWGHRLPVWRKIGENERDQSSYVVAKTRAEAVAKAESENIEQIPDVLDTWFSSALWPFATLGWPQSTDDLAYYYPTDALFTAQDILYLWVVRMVMTGEKFIGQKPFKDVYIHATILDEHGRRMSKSKGNGVDPVEIIGLYGADALRFMLMREAGQRQDMRIKPVRDGRQEQAELARNFANKIWNASRFALLNLGDYRPATLDAPVATELSDRWILSRLDKTAQAVSEGFSTYNNDDAARALYEFIWDDFCDWFIEAAKPRMLGENADSVRHILWFTLDRTLRLLHPIMPYLTETIWQSLPGAAALAEKEFLMLAKFPRPGEIPQDELAEAEWAIVQETVRALRNLRAENNLKPGGTAFVAASSDAARAVLEWNRGAVEGLAKIGLLSFENAPDNSLLAPTRFGDVRLPRPEATSDDLAQERKRIEAELTKMEKDFAVLESRLNDASFAAKAPEAVLAKTRTQHAELVEKRAKLTERLTEMKY